MKLMVTICARCGAKLNPERAVRVGRAFYGRTCFVAIRALAKGE